MRRYGSTTHGVEDDFNLICVLCDAGTINVKLKPVTAGVSVLGIDGGGIRDIIPLEHLAILQDKIGPECPVQSLFDLVAGTSSGRPNHVPSK